MSTVEKNSSSILKPLILILVIGLISGIAYLHVTGSLAGLLNSSLFKVERVKKGDVISITGVCEVMGDVRNPPFLTTNVKVTNIDLGKKLISGVVEDTLEPIDCNLDAVNVEAGRTLPVGYEKIKVGERIKKNAPEVKNLDVYEHLGKDVVISGICKGRTDKEETLVDARSIVVGAIRVGTSWDLKIVSKTRKDSFICNTESSSINPISEQREAQVEAIDYVNKYLIVTGDCPVFNPKFRALKANEKSLEQQNVKTEEIVVLTAAKVQVRTQRIKENKLTHFTGVAKSVKGEPIVECDVENNPDLRIIPEKK